MYINEIFELSMILDHERFHKVFKHIHSKNGYMEKKEDEYIDLSVLFPFIIKVMNHF